MIRSPWVEEMKMRQIVPEHGSTKGEFGDTKGANLP